VDYKGRPVAFQQKHAAILSYDIGNRDLQQCADALMRLRAEYLFGQKRLAEIHFHFTIGYDYTFFAYCRGKRPAPAGNSVRFTTVPPVAATYTSHRNYLDIVYVYAGTISLAGELRPADRLALAPSLLHPGHCFMIVDEATTPSGDTVYKLVKDYTPAQSIYVLQNLSEPKLGCWHRLSTGVIKTASCTFTSYQLKKVDWTGLAALKSVGYVEGIPVEIHLVRSADRVVIKL
jgi:hypothetical protein